MDNTTSTPTATLTPTTPFPASNVGESTQPAPPNATSGTATDAEPFVDRLIKRATAGAHAAVDSVAAKASSLNDGLHGGVHRVGDTRDEWIESARDAIRQHPFAAVAGAVHIGAALLSLNSSRRD